MLTGEMLFLIATGCHINIQCTPCVVVSDNTNVLYHLMNVVDALNNVVCSF